MVAQANVAHLINEQPVSEQEEDRYDRDSEISEDEEDDEECRVCRGPAEAGRPLFAPCKCSGSIGLTHQDCLASWLAVTRGDGKCELCATKFRFAPKYAEGAPASLPLYEVFLGLTSRTFAKWVPLAFRLTVAISLWLVVAPLATSYSYHSWMNRPSSILTRWKRELILGDAISGAVIAGFIIISFLSLMSFADFLRFHWQQHGPGEAPQRARLDKDGQGEVELEPPTEEDIDDVILDMRRQRSNVHIHQVGVMDQRQPLFAKSQRRQHPIRRVRWMDLAAADDLGQDIHHALGAMPTDPLAQRHELQRRIQAAAALRQQVEQLNEEMERINNEQNEPDDFRERLALINEADQDFGHENRRLAEAQLVHVARAIEYAYDNNDDFIDDAANPLLMAMGDNIREGGGNFEEAQLVRFFHDHDEGDEQHMHDNRENDVDEHEHQDEPIFPENDRFEPQFEPLEPVMNREEPVDMEMNVALDELLGLRGPFGALLRNLLWLLAFNVTYLGLFAFVPRSFGALLHSFVLNTTSVHDFMNLFPYYNVTNSTLEGEIGLVQIIGSLEGESKRLSTTLQLSDLATIALGYVSIACSITIAHCIIQFCRKLWPALQDDGANPDPRHDDAAVDPILRIQGGIPFLEPFDDPFNPPGEQLPAELPGTIGEMLALALESTAAIVKVGVLLFLKMFLLPLLLGIWLDASTLSLFQSSAIDRILYAGRDLFSSALLHWVVGITFMLLVTVSVLQLREILHPDLLAKIIRPQEPQPDLLGNLLNENGLVHAKRMAISFGIYAVLLAVHVWIPARIVVATEMSSYLPFLKPRLYYILPSQLQIPVELLMFHLTMLGLLEKYKNSIGETQHNWLAFICDKMGVVDYLLPRNIDKFVLAGYMPIFVHADDSSDSSDLVPEDDIVTATTGSSIEGEMPTNASNKTAKIGNPTIHTHSHSQQQIRDVVQVDPFWYRLTKKPDDVVNLIESNMIPTALFGEKRFRLAKTRQDGQRILVASKGFIRLPLPSGEQDVLDRRRRRAGPDSTPALAQNKGLFASKQGPYRLQRSTRENGTFVIEFWREVPGHLIPRPPEGWDDLGAGGAEVQGRWSWGKEKPSATELGVAYRKPVFSGGASFIAVLTILAKFFFLVSISWIGITVLICSGLSTPLLIGRSAMLLLQLPEKYHHDPFALAIGLAVICPTLVTISHFMKGEVDAFARARLWVSSFSLPPRRKALTVVAAFVLWFFLAPLLVGSMYNLLFFTSNASFATENSFSILDRSFSRTIPSGFLLLNVWAAMCYTNAFTRHFWYSLVNAAFEDDEIARNIRRGQPPRPVDIVFPGVWDSNREHLGHWQGQDGRVGRFISIVGSVFLHWEWDRVDADILIYDFLLPIVRTLCFSLITPLALYRSCCFDAVAGEGTSGILVLCVGLTDVGICRLAFFRIFAVLTLTCQFMLAFQSQLKDWFQVAHKAARDDRYLVGEVLLNYAIEGQD